MTTDQVYDRLRAIGCSVETSDALAPIVAELSDRKRDAFFLWACGASYREVKDQTGISKDSMFRLVKSLRGMVWTK